MVFPPLICAETLPLASVVFDLVISSRRLDADALTDLAFEPPIEAKHCFKDGMDQIVRRIGCGRGHASGALLKRADLVDTRHHVLISVEQSLYHLPCADLPSESKSGVKEPPARSNAIKS